MANELKVDVLAVRDTVRSALKAAGLPKCGVEVYAETVRVEAGHSEVEPAFDALSNAFGFDDMTSRRAITFDGWIIECREPSAALARVQGVENG